MQIFDTHAHYDDKAFDVDREELLQQLHKEENIGRIVNMACSLESTKSSINLANTHDFIYATAGVHPDDVGELTEENFSWLKEVARNEQKVVAIGEIGLDYYWNKEQKEVQKYWFLRQLELARELELPVVIHSRDAAEDTLQVIKGANGKNFTLNMHCFSYSVEIAREYLNMGHYLGIGGVVTFKNSKKLKEVVEYMPLERMLLETDAPYLTPVPFRGKRNDSGKIKYMIEEIARIKNISKEVVLEKTWENACKFYSIDGGKNGETK
jgi:TatD DNase family protein